MSKWTNGPLHVFQPNEPAVLEVQDDNCDAVAHVLSHDYAMLFSAAPDLYEALEAMVKNGHKQGWGRAYEFDMLAAGEALKKARGEKA